MTDVQAEVKVMDYDYWLDKLRITIQSIILFIIAFLTPMKSAIEVLLVVATFDFFAGLAGNVWTGREKFHLRKAFGSLYKIIAFLILVIVAHFAAFHLGEVDFAWVLVKYITFLVIYWYFVNILSNMKKAFPRSSAITFLYLLLSLKILPLVLEKVGLGGEDVQDLANQARDVTKSKYYRGPKDIAEEKEGENETN